MQNRFGIFWYSRGRSLKQFFQKSGSPDGPECDGKAVAEHLNVLPLRLVREARGVDVRRHVQGGLGRFALRFRAAGSAAGVPAPRAVFWTNYDPRARGVVFSAFLPDQLIKNSATLSIMIFS